MRKKGFGSRVFQGFRMSLSVTKGQDASRYLNFL